MRRSQTKTTVTVSEKRNSLKLVTYNFSIADYSQVNRSTRKGTSHWLKKDYTWLSLYGVHSMLLVGSLHGCSKLVGFIDSHENPGGAPLPKGGGVSGSRPACLPRPTCLAAIPTPVFCQPWKTDKYHTVYSAIKKILHYTAYHWNPNIRYCVPLKS